MQHIIIKPWRRCQGTWCQKISKTRENCKNFKLLLWFVLKNLEKLSSTFINSGVTQTQREMHRRWGAKKGLGALIWMRWVSEGMRSISKSCPSPHKYKSTEQFLLVAYLKTSRLNGSKTSLCKLAVTYLSRFGKTENNRANEKSAKQRIALKRQKWLIYLLQIALESI